MLIRYFDGTLRDIPDELGIAILADPSAPEDISEYTPHWVNVIIHSALGALFDEDKSFEENIGNTINDFQIASLDRQEQARKLIKAYNIEVKDEDIGSFPASDMI